MLCRWIFRGNNAGRPWQSIILALFVVLLSLDASPKLRSRHLLYDLVHADLGLIRQRVFEYTGSYQRFVVPINTTYILIAAYGAQAITKQSRSTTAGFITSIFDQSPASSANGHFISANVSVAPGQELFVYVGGHDGYNAEFCGELSNEKHLRYVGGSSDVRTTVDDVITRIVVAGGGGGGDGSSPQQGMLSWLSSAFYSRPRPQGQRQGDLNSIARRKDGPSDQPGRLCTDTGSSLSFTRGQVVESKGTVRAGHGQVIITLPPSVVQPPAKWDDSSVGIRSSSSGSTGRRSSGRGTTRTRRRLQVTTPTGQPTRTPTQQPTRQPTRQPTQQPSRQPSRQPSSQPTRQPMNRPTAQPTRQVTMPLHRLL